jgi:hypothetical protein
LPSSCANYTIPSYSYLERGEIVSTQPQSVETGYPLRVIEVTPAELPIPSPQVPAFEPEPVELPEPVEVPA